MNSATPPMVVPATSAPHARLDRGAETFALVVRGSAGPSGGHVRRRRNRPTVVRGRPHVRPPPRRGRSRAGDRLAGGLARGTDAPARTGDHGLAPVQVGTDAGRL